MTLGVGLGAGSACSALLKPLATAGPEEGTEGDEPIVSG